MPHEAQLVHHHFTRHYPSFRIPHPCRGIVPLVWDDDGSHFRLPSFPRHLPQPIRYAPCSPPAVLNSPHPNYSALKPQSFPYALRALRYAHSFRIPHSHFRLPSSLCSMRSALYLGLSPLTFYLSPLPFALCHFNPQL